MEINEERARSFGSECLPVSGWFVPHLAEGLTKGFISVHLAPTIHTLWDDFHLIQQTL